MKGLHGKSANEIRATLVKFAPAFSYSFSASVTEKCPLPEQLSLRKVPAARAESDNQNRGLRQQIEKANDRGHDQIVQMLFRAHAAPIGELLEKAIDQGHAGIVRALLTKDGTLATTEALERASSDPGGVEIVQALLSAGAQPSAMSLEGASGMRNATVVQAMLDQGATPTDEAIYNACRSGDATVVRMLLKLRVERGLLDIYSTGLELAGSGGVVHALLAAGASPHAAFRALCGALYKTHPRMTKLGARVAEARANPIFDGIQKAVIECCGASYCRRLTTSAE